MTLPHVLVASENPGAGDPQREDRHGRQREQAGEQLQPPRGWRDAVGGLAEGHVRGPVRREIHRPAVVVATTAAKVRVE